MDVFVLHHNSGEENEKLIGIYSSLTAAKEAISRLRIQPGFRESSGNFLIERYRLDEDHWREGYVTPEKDSCIT